MHINLVDTLSPEAEAALYQQHTEDRRRSRIRLHVRAEDVARMVQEFVASRWSITICPPTYAAPSPHYHVAPAKIGRRGSLSLYRVESERPPQ